MGNGPKQTILTGGPQTADRKWKDAHGSGQRGDASQNHGRKRRRDRNRGSLAPRVRCGLARGGLGLGTTHAPAHTRTGKDGAGRHPGDWRSASEEAQPRGRTGEASRAEGHGCLTVSSVRGLRALESRERAGVVVPGLGVGRGGRRCRAKGGACARGQSRGARKPDACCAGSMAVLGTARRTRGGVRPVRRACEGPWEPARRRKPLPRRVLHPSRRALDPRTVFISKIQINKKVK